ncbi:MAG: hypothetical protein HY699_16080 [Deltaproteobacteria bacterium]|nr:hypothetical protein [Deltaproteobacteria bacterium]
MDDTNEPIRSTNASALYPLAVKAADAGDYARVSELFAAVELAALSPAEAACWQRLLTEAGDLAAAATLAAEHSSGPQEEPRSDVPLRAGALLHASGGDGGGDPDPKTLRAGALLPPAAPEEGEDDFLDFEPGPREAASAPAPPPLVDAMLRWFGGRGDVYARQWYDARRDQSGYWPVREPLTARVMELHLLGRITLGQYVLHPDSTVSFAALDFDPTPAALEQMRLAAGDDGALGCAPIADYVRRVLATAAQAGLPAVAEDSGGVGLHLWLFFAPRLLAPRARALLRELLARAGPQPPAVAVEIFPKQDALSGKGLGNLIKLPLGVHQATMRASQLLTAELQPLAAEEALASLRPCPPARIEALLLSRIIPFPTRTASEALSAAVAPAPPAPAGPTPRALAEALATIPAGREAERAADRVLSGCAVVRQLARQAHEERTLSADAARALLYTVGLIGRDNERIEAMFANAGVSGKELERVRAGLQGPMGCKKLRERFAALCHGCVCPAAPAAGYATPALFALVAPPKLARRAALVPAVEEAAVSAESTATDIEQRLARIEAALQRLQPAPTEEE